MTSSHPSYRPVGRALDRRDASVGVRSVAGRAGSSPRRFPLGRWACVCPGGGGGGFGSRAPGSGGRCSWRMAQLRLRASAILGAEPLRAGLLSYDGGGADDVLVNVATQGQTATSAEAGVPVTGLTVQVHHGDNPDLIGLVYVDHRIREAQRERPTGWWIELEELTRVSANCRDGRLDLIIIAFAQLGPNLCVITGRLGVLGVSFRMKGVWLHRPTI